MREIEPTVQIEQEQEQEKPGHKAEAIVVEFLRSGTPHVTGIEKTLMFDSNDRNGVDFVCEIDNEYKLAVDVTFDGDERRELKMERQLRNPLVRLRNERGEPVGEEIPRILFYCRSIALWFDYKKKAEERGMELISVMDKNTIEKQRGRFIKTVLDQANGLSRLDKRYGEKIEPIKRIFEGKEKKIAA